MHRRFAAQCFEERPFDDRRHLPSGIELVSSRVHRRHSLARVSRQRADPFKRVARPVEDRCGSPPKVMRSPPLRPQAGNEALYRKGTSTARTPRTHGERRRLQPENLFSSSRNRPFRRLDWKRWGVAKARAARRKRGSGGPRHPDAGDRPPAPTSTNNDSREAPCEDRFGHLLSFYLSPCVTAPALRRPLVTRSSKG